MDKDVRVVCLMGASYLDLLFTFSPRAGCRYPVDTGLFVSGGMDGVVKLWDTNVLEVALEFDFKSKVRVLWCEQGPMKTFVALRGLVPRTPYRYRGNGAFADFNGLKPCRLWWSFSLLNSSHASTFPYFLADDISTLSSTILTCLRYEKIYTSLSWIQNICLERHFCRVFSVF